MDIKKKSFVVLLYALPFAALLLIQLGNFISVAVTARINIFIVYLLSSLLFSISLSLVIGRILLEASLSFFEDRKHSDLIKILYGGKAFLPVKPIVFVVVFTAAFIYLSYDLQSLNFFKCIMMLLPSAALLSNLQFFLSGRIRFISGSYISYKKDFNEIISYYFDVDGKLVFITVDGNEINTGLLLTGDNLAAFEKECTANGLKSKN